MQSIEAERDIKATIDETLHSLDGVGFCALRFPAALEQRFEADTCQSRSYRMWLEGLVAILGLNAALILDSAIVKDIAWLAVVRQTAMITPVALVVNWLVRKNPAAWLREGGVALAMVSICVANLFVEGNATLTSTFFGVLCTLITALFVGVVMRLRFRYVVASVVTMLGACLWSLETSPCVSRSEAVMAISMMLIGVGILVVASHSLEREERKSYLLRLQWDLLAEEQALANAALLRLSSLDKLTGLPNRRTLEERFERLWAECASNGEWLSAVVVDVDHFKQVNDRHGHLYGDETLRRIGALLPQALRGLNDMAARFGGEEFVLLLPHADGEMANSVAERARQLVEAAGTPLNATASRTPPHWITVSCGVSSCRPTAGLAWTDLVAAADEALYAAKHSGRNCVRFREVLSSEVIEVCDMLERGSDVLVEARIGQTHRILQASHA